MKYFFPLLLVMGCAQKTAGSSGADTGGASSSDTDTSASWEGLEWAVDTPGPYGIGYRTWDVQYDPGLGEGLRTVRLNLWYPTEQTDGETPTYTVGSSDDSVVLDAAPAPPVHGGHYPVHAHSHGDQGWGATSAFLSRYLASHGWVTVAPDHTDNTLLDNEDPKPTDIYIHRAKDISASLDALEGLASDDPLHELADTTSVVLSGHSAGAYTTWAAGGAAFDMATVRSGCEEDVGSCTDAELAAFSAGLGDERIVAAVPMAGTYRDEWFGDSGYRSASAPYLYLSGSNDAGGQEEQWMALTEMDLTWVELTGGCHQSFALGACATLDVETGFHIVQTYVLSFARRYVLGDDDPTVMGILDGSISVAPEAVFQRR